MDSSLSCPSPSSEKSLKNSESSASVSNGLSKKGWGDDGGRKSIESTSGLRFKNDAGGVMVAAIGVAEPDSVGVNVPRTIQNIN